MPKIQHSRGMVEWSIEAKQKQNLRSGVARLLKSCSVSYEPPWTLLHGGLLSFERNFDEEAVIRWTDIQGFNIKRYNPWTHDYQVIQRSYDHTVQLLSVIFEMMVHSKSEVSKQQELVAWVC